METCKNTPPAQERSFHAYFQGLTPQDAQNDVTLVQLIEPVLGLEPIVASQHQDELEQITTFVTHCSS
ncbi:hypothetical protein [Nostoc sp. MG11]|uniref:hypothetical protein n=1 Tax=Nostoc sp. MG11 TaxID=2721166 RepID=UPI001868A8A1|nr:hypothetical protein [Nostoc sp. MG11]